MKPNLNEYAATIAHVFEKIAVLYGPMKPDHLVGYDWGKAGIELMSTLDADTCAEIIQVARTIEETQ